MAQTPYTLFHGDNMFKIPLRLFIISYYFFLILALPLHSLNEPKCACGPIPEWVKEIPVSFDISQLRRDQKKRNLLINVQVNIDEEIQYFHQVDYLVTPKAVQQNSNLEIDFDPSYETVTLHKLCVHRNNEKIDKLATARMEVIQQEQDINRYLYNGRKAWVIFLDDMHPGDILEYSISLKGFNPIFQGYFNRLFYLQDFFPIDYANYRLLASSNRNIDVLKCDTSVPITHQQTDDVQEWSWEISHVPAYQHEPSQPAWFIDLPRIQVSEFHSWNEVALWGCELFNCPKDYSKEMHDLIDSWKSQNSNIEDQLLCAIRFVQNEIRYFGFETGINSHLPQEPSATLKCRYGDCKDKTLLLMAFMDMLGVESYPLLVSAQMHEHLESTHPGITYLDHVILQVHYKDLIFWIDPTYAHQGGNLHELHCYGFQKGLPLKKETQELATSPGLTAEPTIHSWTTFAFNDSELKTGLEVQMMYRGEAANRMRHRFLEEGLDELSKKWRRDYSKMYGEIHEASSFEYLDNFEDNIITIDASYEITNPWNIDEERNCKQFYFFPDNISWVLNFHIDQMRKTPLQIDYHPLNVVDEIFLISKEWDPLSEETTLNNDEIEFHKKQSANGKTMHVKHELTIKKDHVPVASLAKHRKLLQSIYDEASMEVMIPLEFNSENGRSEGVLSFFDECYRFITNML